MHKDALQVNLKRKQEEKGIRHVRLYLMVGKACFHLFNHRVTMNRGTLEGKEASGTMACETALKEVLP